MVILQRRLEGLEVVDKLRGRKGQRCGHARVEGAQRLTGDVNPGDECQTD